MSWIDRLEKRFGSIAIPNLALYLVGAQLLVYVLVLTGQVGFGALPLIPARVIGAGEFWRLVSFVLSPPFVADSAFSALFLAFFWYIFWMMSSALESEWGVFRFNLFLFLGILLTVLAAFLGHFVSALPPVFVRPDFLYLSVFFAFATLHPNFEFLLFFVLPVKVKWLAWLTAGLIAFAFLFAPSLGTRVAILGPVLNYLLFFGKDLAAAMQGHRRRARFEADAKAASEAAFHTCATCGATDKSHPDRAFRYKTEAGEPVCVCDACRQSALAEGG